MDEVDVTGMSVQDARLAREVVHDCAAGLTHQESAARLGISSEKAWILLSHVQANIRSASVTDHRLAMVEKLILAEQVLMGIMDGRYVRTSASGHVVTRGTGVWQSDPDGTVREVLEEVEDPGPRIQAAAALSLVVSRHSKLVGADAAPPPALPVGPVQGTIEEEIAALAIELGLSDGPSQ